MSEPFVGEIRIMPYIYAPRGWAACEGQLLPIRGNEILYSVIGTYYGGDGMTNFALPNLKGRVPLGVGLGPGLSIPHNIAESHGVSSLTLEEDELPSHNHTLRVTRKSLPESAVPASNLMPHKLVDNDETEAYPAFKQMPTYVSEQMATKAIKTAGGVEAHENKQPYLVLQYCIATEGLYPVRP